MSRNFGASLVFPGGGFLLSAFDDGGALCFSFPARYVYALAFAVSVGIFAASVVFWFGAGNVILPVFVYFGAAFLSAVTAPPTLSVLTLFEAFSPLFLTLGSTALVPFANHVLTAKHMPHPLSYPKANPAADLEQTTLGLTRYILDRALQPVDQFHGFQWVDQFQTAAVRYQIAQCGYALSILQKRLPALGGYLEIAQQNLITKQRHHRVWRYWWWENLWGNFQNNADPIQRDNIMYTGFVAAQICAFENGTGNFEFQNKNSFDLTTTQGITFSHDKNTLIQSLFNGWKTSKFTLMPCEPNWVYPLCNAVGSSAAIASSPKKWNDIAPDFRKALDEEFTEKWGNITPFKSTYTGINAPRVGGAIVEAYPTLFWNTVYPDMATAQWDRARARAIRNGNLNTQHFWKVDTGDYRFSRAASLAGFAAAAAEMGDVEAVTLSLEQLDQGCPVTLDMGRAYRKKASIFAMATELIARANSGDVMRSLFVSNPVAHDRPMLDLRDHTQANVTKAEYEDACIVIELKGQAPSINLPLINFPPNKEVTWSGTVSGQSKTALLVCAQSQFHWTAVAK